MIEYNVNGVKENLTKKPERDIFHIVRKILRKTKWKLEGKNELYGLIII